MNLSDTLLLSSLCFLASCSNYSPAPSASPPSASYANRGLAPQAKAEDSSSAPSAKKARSGLATSWGESQSSYVGEGTSFDRANGKQPTSTGSLFYNDPTGLAAMMARSGSGDRSSFRGLTECANGLVSIGLKDGRGSWLKGWKADGQVFVEGQSGERYEIWLKNNTGVRLETVVSVDGLDVMDGAAASYRKRGYLLAPHESMVIDGFRQSSSHVAAFRFGSVADSYAQLRHGDTLNVGVIGVAAFHEKGSDPYRWRDTDRRWTADPFPSQRRWATPPTR